MSAGLLSDCCEGVNTPEVIEHAATVDGAWCTLIIKADGRVNYTGPLDNTPALCGNEAVALFVGLRTLRGSFEMEEFIRAAMEKARATWPAQPPTVALRVESLMSLYCMTQLDPLDRPEIAAAIAEEIREAAQAAQLELTREWKTMLETLLKANEEQRHVVKEIEFKEGVEGHPYMLGKITVLEGMLKMANRDIERFSPARTDVSVS